MLEVIHEKEQHRVVAKNNQQVVATLIYEINEHNDIVIVHTITEHEADEKYAHDLVLIVVDYARRHDRKVVPASPLAARTFQKEPEKTEDVRATY